MVLTVWSYVGFALMGISVLIFVACVRKRQWSAAALSVGLLHLLFAFFNIIVVFFDALNPEFGYNLGLVHADIGVALVIFAFAMVVGALASACIAVLNRHGERNYFIVAFDSFLLLVLIPWSITNVTEPGSGNLQVQFGESLQFSDFPALLFVTTLVLGPWIIGVLWAWRRAKASV